MRKAVIAFIATVSLTCAGVLVAAPMMNSTHASLAGASIDILSLTRSASNLPDQSYPTH